MAFRRRTVLSTLVAIGALALMLTVTIVNVDGLTHSVRQLTYDYLRDVSEPSTQVIQERFAGRLDSLNIIGNSMAFAAILDKEEFLQRKLSETEFEALAYVRRSGSVTIADADGTRAESGVLSDFAESQALAATFRGMPAAGFYGDYVAFMQPIAASEATGVQGVMIGIRTKESLQNLLVSDAFGDKGFTFIVDQYGQIVAEPMAEADYEALSALMHDLIADDDRRAALLQSGNADADALEGAFETEQGTTLLLDYRPLAYFNWSVVTAVEQDLLSDAVDAYVVRIIVTLTALIAVLAALLFLLLAQQRRYQKRVERLAFVDPLTDGMSFIRFRMLAEPLIEKSGQGEYALATLNVKQFKLINRLGGSQAGDAVLRAVYEIIHSNLDQPDEMAAHSTADNFVLLLRNKGEEELSQRLRTIAQEIEDLHTVIPVRTSAGVYVAAGADPDADLIVCLDRSNMARASAASEYGSTCVFYDTDFMEKQAERLRMISMVEEGLREKQFSVYLQPKVSPVTSRLVGSEALIRWRHPTYGMIGPDAFVPLCEQNGLIRELDMYVFERVCEYIRSWQDHDWRLAPVSVNVSGLHLKEPDFVQKYREIADRHGVSPEWLEMELTESVMCSNLEVEEARSVIDTIHGYGFRCSMDDFGSGYSALGLLAELPINCIKLDRSFFLDCIGNVRAQTVIAWTIKLCRELAITTVAEGIETREQVEMLKKMGIDMIQGFYYSRPLPVKEFEELVFVDQTTFPVKQNSSQGDG